MPIKRTLPKTKSGNVLGQARKPAKMFRAGIYARFPRAISRRSGGKTASCESISPARRAGPAEPPHPAKGPIQPDFGRRDSTDRSIDAVLGRRDEDAIKLRAEGAEVTRSPSVCPRDEVLDSPILATERIWQGGLPAFSRLPIASLRPRGLSASREAFSTRPVMFSRISGHHPIICGFARVMTGIRRRMVCPYLLEPPGIWTSVECAGGESLFDNSNSAQRQPQSNWVRFASPREAPARDPLSGPSNSPGLGSFRKMARP